MWGKGVVSATHDARRSASPLPRNWGRGPTHATQPEDLLASADTTPAQQPVLPPDRFFGEDKWTHFLVSALATAVSAAGAEAAGLEDDASLAAGAGVGFTLGVGKELRDRGRPEARASWLDLVWDAAGVGLGVLVVSQTR